MSDTLVYCECETIEDCTLDCDAWKKTFTAVLTLKHRYKVRAKTLDEAKEKVVGLVRKKHKDQELVAIEVSG